MQVVFANTTRCLSHSLAKFVNLTLLFSQDYKDSRLFKKLNPELAFQMRTKPLTFHNHREGVLLSTYSDDKFGLGLIFDILATSFDLDEV